MKSSRGKDGVKRAGITVGYKPIIAIGILVVLALMFGPPLKNIWDMKQEIKALKMQKAALLKRNAELIELQKSLKTDEAIEKLAREELGMIKPDEKVIVKVIPENKKNDVY